MRVRYLAVVGAVGVLALAASCRAASNASLSAGAAALACPGRDRTVPVSSRPGATSSLVPEGVREVLLCRYSGVGPRPVPAREAFRLLDDLLVTERSTVSSLASQFNALPPALGAVACPADFGTAIIAVFRYPSGAEDPVKAGLSGCTLVTNGHRTRTAASVAGSRLLNQLKAMTSGTGVGISHKVRTTLLKDALRSARNAGDPHPYDIEAVKTTYLEAESLFGPDRSYDIQNWAPVYVFAERGKFTAYLSSPPAGAAFPTGTVEGAILTPSLRVTDGYLSNHYPQLRAAGKPVRLQ